MAPVEEEEQRKGNSFGTQLDRASASLISQIGAHIADRANSVCPSHVAGTYDVNFWKGGPPPKQQNQLVMTVTYTGGMG